MFKHIFNLLLNGIYIAENTLNKEFLLVSANVVKI